MIAILGKTSTFPTPCLTSVEMCRLGPRLDVPQTETRTHIGGRKGGRVTLLPHDDSRPPKVGQSHPPRKNGRTDGSLRCNQLLVQPYN